MTPNFFIVGAAKSGTTSLYHYLSDHPQVFMTEPKEVNYFSGPDLKKQNLFYKDYKARDEQGYLNLFKGSDSYKAVGEGSVSYLFYPSVAKKIYDKFSDAKIIILLRNPVDRGYSHYLMDQRLGMVDCAYKDIVFKRYEGEKAKLYYQQYVELGLYYHQVKRYLDLFGEKQVKVYLTEDLKTNLQGVIDDLYDFLGLEKSKKPDLEKQHNTFSLPKNPVVAKLYATHYFRRVLSIMFPSAIKNFIFNTFFERSQKPELSEEVLLKLHEIYDQDVKLLEQLIERDLSNWYLEEFR